MQLLSQVMGIKGPPTDGAINEEDYPQGFTLSTMTLGSILWVLYTFIWPLYLCGGTMESSKLDLSVLIPLYNEEELPMNYTAGLLMWYNKWG